MNHQSWVVEIFDYIGGGEFEAVADIDDPSAAQAYFRATYPFERYRVDITLRPVGRGYVPLDREALAKFKADREATTAFYKLTHVEKCPRCEGSHHLGFRPFKLSGGARVWDRWATCPETGEPILGMGAPVKVREFLRRSMAAEAR